MNETYCIYFSQSPFLFLINSQIEILGIFISLAYSKVHLCIHHKLELHLFNLVSLERVSHCA